MPKIIARKQDWIQLGYKLFSEEGISGIIIEKMASILKVNKSSFYWHFKTKQEFIEQLILFWVDHDTMKIIELTNQESTAVDRFIKLLVIIYKKDPYLDFIFYLKRYAIQEKHTQTIIDTVDHERIAYVQKLLEDMGYISEEAHIKSSLLYKHLIGYHEMMRYKKQNNNYIEEVRTELQEFIQF